MSLTKATPGMIKGLTLAYLGAGSAAYLNVGQVANTVAAGDDPRFGGLGGGNVSYSGTPITNQLAQWTSVSTIQGISIGTGLAITAGVLSVSASSGTVPTGTGFVHITSGAQDSAARLLVQADVAGLTTSDSPTFVGVTAASATFTGNGVQGLIGTVAPSAATFTTLNANNITTLGNPSLDLSPFNTIIRGATKALRVYTNSLGTAIEGTDNTGTGSYQNLYVGGGGLDFTLSGITQAQLRTGHMNFQVALSATNITGTNTGDQQALRNYQNVTLISGVGNTSLSFATLEIERFFNVVVGAGSGPYNATVTLTNTNAIAGAVMSLSLSCVGSSNPVITIRNLTSSGTILATVIGEYLPRVWTISCQFDGTNWQLINYQEAAPLESIAALGTLDISYTGSMAEPLQFLVTLPTVFVDMSVPNQRTLYKPTSGVAINLPTSFVNTSFETPTITSLTLWNASQITGSSAFASFSSLTALNMPALVIAGSMSMASLPALATFTLPLMNYGNFQLTTLNALTDFNMPSWYSGQLTTGSTITSLSSIYAPNLTILANFSGTYPALSTISFPSLVYSQGTFSPVVNACTTIILSSLNACSSFTGTYGAYDITLPALTKIATVAGGLFSPIALSAVSFNLPKLGVGSISIATANALTAFNCPLLSSAPFGIQLTTSALALSTINFPNLVTTQLWNIVNTTSLTGINLPQLATITVGGLGSTTMPNLISVSAPSLTNIATNVLFNTCNALSTISFPSLVQGGVSITSCSAIPFLNFPPLTGAFAITANTMASLTGLSFPSLKNISGSVTITAVPNLSTVSFPALLSAGSISITSATAVTGISFPLLTGCSLIQVTTPALSSLYCPLLSFIGTVNGGITINSNALTSIQFPALNTVIGNSFSITVPTNLSALYFPVLNTINIGSGTTIATNGTSLSSIDFPSLTGMNATFGPSSSPNVGYMNFPALSTISGQFLPSGLTGIYNASNFIFPVLSSVGSNFQPTSFTNLSGTLSFPSLRNVQLGFAPGTFSALSALSFPLLNSVAGTFGPTTMAQLVSMSFPLLSSVGYGTSGNFTISTFGSLSSITFPSLQSVNGTMVFSNAANLSAIYFPSLSAVNSSITATTGLGNLTIVQLGTSSTLKRVGGAVNFSGQKLIQSSVDGILTQLALLDGTNGTTAYSGQTVTLNGGTNSTPSSTGLTAKATLVARSCTVNNN